MSQLILPEPFLKMAESGRVTASDVVILRGEVFGDDLASKIEAEAMIALDRAARHKCPEWSGFLSEVLTNFIVYQEDPEGVISQDNADWLRRCISRNGLVDSPEMFEMLVKVLEKARQSPESLMSFALEQVKAAVLENQGPLSASGTHDKKIICKSDVELIRRLMYAFGGDGGMAVTRVEAEFLFDLNDQTIEFKNDPAWSDLFVKAVGNHLMATLGNAVPKRTVALRGDKWLDGESITDKLINSLKSVYRAAQNPADLVENAYSTNNSVVEEGLKKAAAITADESQWVANRIGADGVLHENERALLGFLEQQSSDLPVRLKQLLKSAA